VTKTQILRRIKILLDDVRRMVTQSKYLGEDCQLIEAELDEIVRQYACLVDDYMAGVINRHNRAKDVDASVGADREFSGKWNTGRASESRKSKKNCRLDEPE
jgi:hypothetical protein